MPDYRVELEAAPADIEAPKDNAALVQIQVVTADTLRDAQKAALARAAALLGVDASRLRVKNVKEL